METTRRVRHVGLVSGLGLVVAAAATILATQADASEFGAAVADCVLCQHVAGGCDAGDHKARNEGVSPLIDHIGHGYHSMCLSGTCCWASSGGACDHSEGCVAGFASSKQTYDDALRAVDSRNVNALATLILKHPTKVQYNVDRSSIQLIGCQNAVIANLPMGEAVERQLAKLLE